MPFRHARVRRSSHDRPRCPILHIRILAAGLCVCGSLSQFLESQGDTLLTSSIECCWEGSLLLPPMIASLALQKVHGYVGTSSL
jgi:hypothetical protein